MRKIPYYTNALRQHARRSAAAYLYASACVATSKHAIRSYCGLRRSAISGASLHAEHKELRVLFASLDRASQRGDEMACRVALDHFTRLPQDHLLTENRHLYGYFARHADPDPAVARHIDAMSGRMLLVGKILHRFIRTYVSTAWTPMLSEQLKDDIREISALLHHRIHEEETVLCPPYLPRDC